jgi:hypothetical protein
MAITRKNRPEVRAHLTQELANTFKRNQIQTLLVTTPPRRQGETYGLQRPTAPSLSTGRVGEGLVVAYSFLRSTGCTWGLTMLGAHPVVNQFSTVPQTSSRSACQLSTE